MANLSKQPSGSVFAEILMKIKLVISGLGLFWGLFLSVCAGQSATIYTNEASFVNALGASESFLNDFDDLTESGPLVHSLQYSSNGLAYYISSNPNLHVYALVGAVTTWETNDLLITTFTSTNVHAVGGWFYVTDTNGNATDGSVAVTLNGGVPAVISSSTNGPLFWGYVSGGLLLTNLTIQSLTPGGYPTLDHFYVSEGEPVFAPPFVATNLFVLSWPAPSTGYVLQSTTDISASVWPPVEATPQNINNYWQVAVPMSNSTAFFRLVKQ
jgi:hypothetical protein